jgi:FkbM family methyltransferase
MAVRTLRLTNVVRRLLGPIAERLIWRISSDPEDIFVVQGHKMILATGDGRPVVGMVADVYEETTSRLFHRLLKPEMMVVDIGAHVGYFTLIAAKQVGPAGKVLAFEPDADNHAALLKNIAMNDYQNITVAQKAVSEQEGSAQLHLTQTGSGRHSMFHHGLPERGSVDIETTTLDATLKELGWPHVDLIKIDVEGAEVSVLSGMAQLLENQTDLKLVVEFMPELLHNAGVTPQQFFDKLTSLDPEIYFIDEANGIVPIAVGDGSSLVSRLLAAEISGNLLCTWGSTEREYLLKI